MKTLLAGLVLCGGLSACGSPQTPQERLIGDWIYIDASGTSGEGIDVKSDGTYVVSVIQETSATSANVQQETGIYVATDSQITATPQEWTCPGPDPVTTMQYTFSGDDLVVSGPTGLISLTPNTAAPTSGAVLVFGCFQANGTFVTAPLAPVGN